MVDFIRITGFSKVDNRVNSQIIIFIKNKHVVFYCKDSKGKMIVKKKIARDEFIKRFPPLEYISYLKPERGL